MIINTSIAKQIMGSNFIGVEELKTITMLNFQIDRIPDIPYSIDELTKKKDTYLLILGVSHFHDGTSVTIRNLRKVFGCEPAETEPCFYNQDWYDQESFIDIPMEDRWFLIRKNVFEDSRAVQPNELVEKYVFPSAITCTYSFFVTWLTLEYKLWYHDFVWCNDVDHNGDRIYVGKYNDVDGVNRNGFSIHRHLNLRQCYGCID